MKTSKEVQAVLDHREKAEFVPFSYLPISERARESISQSGNITFGDANRTLVTVRRILDEMDGTKKDELALQQIIKQFGEWFYVDLEN